LEDVPNNILKTMLQKSEDWSHRMLAIVTCRMFCFPVYYPNI